MSTRHKVVAGMAVLLVGCVVGFGVARLLDDEPDTSAATSRAIQASQQQRAALDVAAKRRRNEFLFSQAAAGGSLLGADDQHLTLSLAGVDDWVTRFTDRPARDAQTVDIRDFLARWHERFGRTPPNAVLSFRVPGVAAPREIVLELSAPRYDAPAHKATYSARRIALTADRLPGTRHPRPPIVVPTPRTFGAASLFVDSSGDEEYATFMNEFGSGLRFAWAPSPTSQCAGYGEDGTAVADGDVVLHYRSFSDGRCAFEPTYSRWNVYSTEDSLGKVKFGTVTFDSKGAWVSCTCLSCNQGTGNGETPYWVHITSIAPGSTYPPDGIIDPDTDC